MSILNPFMTDPAGALAITMSAEFEKILENGAVGAPVQVGDYTVVPLLITTFGIGVGGGSVWGEPVGGGGGGGVIPCAVLVFGPNGVDLKMVVPEVTRHASDSVVQVVREATARYPKSRTSETVPV